MCAAAAGVMRVLVVNDGVSDVGGVQVYLGAVVSALAARGHAVALAYCTDSGSSAARAGWDRYRQFSLNGRNRAASLQAVGRWEPDVCFSHNMRDLAVERLLADVAPIVKFMHGYSGTCVGGQKMHRFPRAEACQRQFSTACAGLFLIRRCGRLSPTVLLDELRWAREQQRLFPRYAAIVVASEHMRCEYVANGGPADRVHVNPLFTPHDVASRDGVPAGQPAVPTVAFLGRMTPLKGGDLLLQAVRLASDRLGRPIGVLMMGDGPMRPHWEDLGRRLGLPCTFTGWLDDDRRWEGVRRSSIVALPSVWPEPFGLVGLEAGALGVPAIATDVGGVREWLRDGLNGALVPGPPSPE